MIVRISVICCLKIKVKPILVELNFLKLLQIFFKIKFLGLFSSFINPQKEKKITIYREKTFKTIYNEKNIFTGLQNFILPHKEKIN